MDPDAVAKAFVEHYYTTFDTNRSNLGNLYQDASMLTFEGQKVQGAANIVAKLTGLPFQQCQHSITTVDCQPSGAGGMLVFVSGNLQLVGEQHALKFSQRLVMQRSVKVPSVEIYRILSVAYVPFDANTTGKLLCAERYLPLELCMRPGTDRTGDQDVLSLLEFSEFGNPCVLVVQFYNFGGD
ncbi:Nuclear transport factor 2A-like protein [Drosera capensis]